MKFTCDSCGAQYLISDDKIGPRGVKVRCKKCSHVIILRPGELAAEGGNGHAATGTNGSQPMTGGSASDVPVAPSVAAAQASSALPDQVLGATSSDLGLSQEFRALGFEEDDAPAPRAATLSVGLDIDGAPREMSSASPFSSERAGGSLDFVPPPDAEPSPESTAVQARPSQPFDQEETEMIGDSGDPPTVTESTDRHDQDALGAPAGLGAAAPEHDDDDEDAATRVESLQDLARDESPEPEGAYDADHGDEEVHVEEEETQAGESPFADAWQGEATSQTVEPPVAASDDSPAAASGDVPVATSGDLAAALDAVQRDEVADMRASIEADVSGLGDELEGFSEEGAARTEVEPSPAQSGSNGASALAALADAEGDDAPAADPAPAGDGPRVRGESSSYGEGAAYGSAEPGEDSIADEIGSAFEAMFGDDGPDLEGAAEGGAGGEQDELASLQQALGTDDGNKAETRVFDTDAMAKVEAEQDRAAAESSHEVPEAKEWYVAIDEEQVGPLSKSEVQAHWDEGKLEADSLCWRAGMGDWTPVAETEGLAELVPPEPEPRVPTVLDDDGVPSTAEPAPVVASAAPEDEPAAAAPVDDPPKIEPQPEPAPRAESEPAWRPSAASALASLAAEELAAPDAIPAASLGASAPVSDEVGALPASDALEKLLDGDADKGSASQFGAAEKSESFVRPLPRRADTVSSLPLRDPTADKPKSNWAVPAAILAGFLLLGLMVLGGIKLFQGDDPTPPATAVAAVGGQPGLVDSKMGTSPEAAAKAAADAKAAELAEAEAKAKLEAEAKAKLEAEAKAAELAKAEAAAKAKARKPRRSSRRRSRSTRPEPAPPRSKPEPVAAVRPAPRRSGSVEDDLLGVAKPSKRRRSTPAPEPDLPDQLDDSDVLKVLRSNRGDVRRCLDKQASTDPSLEGTMTVELLIRRSGRPKGVRVQEDKFKRSAAGTCMVAAVKRWRFPKFSGAPMPLDFPVRVRAR